MTKMIQSGQVEAVVGGMFAGKSDWLIRRLRRAVRSKDKVVAFKPLVDTRHGGDAVASHEGETFPAYTIRTSAEIGPLIGVTGATVVGIDEVQFFDEGIVDVVKALSFEGRRVIVAGLDLDYRGVPFGPVPHLLAVADVVVKLHAVCVVCGADATRSQRIVDSQEQVVIGGSSAYEARCRKHWSPEPVFHQRDGGTAFGVGE